MWRGESRSPPTDDGAAAVAERAEQFRIEDLPP
jgi:hypothetical protein